MIKDILFLSLLLTDGSEIAGGKKRFHKWEEAHENMPKEVNSGMCIATMNKCPPSRRASEMETSLLI